MLVKFRLERTDNNIGSIPNFSRLRGLARRYCAGQKLEPTEANLDHFQGLFELNYHALEKEGGICVGMVCEWSFVYLMTGDPARKPQQAPSQMHQGDAFITVFKRVFMAKLDDTTAIAERKMFAKHGMTLTALRSKPLPGNTVQFAATVQEISSLLESVSGLPCVLSVPPISGGRHALGLLQHGNDYYVLEPNEGLFRYPNRTVFEANLSNHAIQKFSPGKDWKLSAIQM